MTEADKILRTMWHRTRKCFVPRTLDEVCDLSRLRRETVNAAIYDLCRDGLTKSSRAHDVRIFELTEAGKRRVMQ